MYLACLFSLFSSPSFPLSPDPQTPVPFCIGDRCRTDSRFFFYSCRSLSTSTTIHPTTQPSNNCVTYCASVQFLAIYAPPLSVPSTVLRARQQQIEPKKAHHPCPAARRSIRRKAKQASQTVSLFLFPLSLPLTFAPVLDIPACSAGFHRLKRYNGQRQGPASVSRPSQRGKSIRRPGTRKKCCDSRPGQAAKSIFLHPTIPTRALRIASNQATRRPSRPR